MKIKNQILFYAMIFFAFLFACSIMINNYIAASILVIGTLIVVLYSKGEPKIVNFIEKII